MRYLRWVFIALYIIVVAGLLAKGLQKQGNEKLTIVVILAAMIVSQAIFILGAGTIELCRPVRKRRLLIPVVVASVMMAVLAAGLFLALSELCYLDEDAWIEQGLWVFIALNWIIWGIVFFIHSRNVERYKVILRLTRIILAGSLIELLVSIPSHIIVSRRPGCFVGMSTMLGIVAGVYVMLWAFGPGIIVLFLRDKHKHHKQATTID